MLGLFESHLGLVEEELLDRLLLRLLGIFFGFLVLSGFRL